MRNDVGIGAEQRQQLAASQTHGLFLSNVARGQRNKGLFEVVKDGVPVLARARPLRVQHGLGVVVVQLNGREADLHILVGGAGDHGEASEVILAAAAYRVGIYEVHDIALPRKVRCPALTSIGRVEPRRTRNAASVDKHQRVRLVLVTEGRQLFHVELVHRQGAGGGVERPAADVELVTVVRRLGRLAVDVDGVDAGAVHVGPTGGGVLNGGGPGAGRKGHRCEEFDHCGEYYSINNRIIEFTGPY